MLMKKTFKFVREKMEIRSTETSVLREVTLTNVVETWYVLGIPVFTKISVANVVPPLQAW
jgi:hypothetical protein